MSSANSADLKKKIGQMLMVGFKGTTLNPTDAIAQAILAQQIGGVILFDYNFETKTFDRNINNPQQLKQLTQQLQDCATEAATHHDTDQTPLLIGIDYEGGKVNRLKEQAGFPKTVSAVALGTSTPEQVQYYAEQMATTLQAAGINLNFAPVVDVNVNPTNPIIGQLDRSFSSDPQTVVDCAAVFAKAHQAHGIVCVYKHFPGHGSSTGDTHKGFVDVSQTWQDKELAPYEQLLQPANPFPMVMTAHVVHRGLDSKGYPASLSATITKGLLREKLNFKGVVVTDDMQMKAITDRYGLEEAVRLAVNAGADMLVFGNQLVPHPQDPHQLVEMIYRNVIEGKILESRIEEAYQRIMALKRMLKEKCTA